MVVMKRIRLLTILPKVLWSGFLLAYTEKALNLPPNLCNYAGYLSTLGKDGKCQSPWQIEGPDLGATLEKLYTPYRTCFGTRTHIIRCNPILYGFQSEHQNNSLCIQGKRDTGIKGYGCCVRVSNQWESSSTTRQCNQSIFGGHGGQAFKRFVDSMVEDPARLAHYLAVASSFIKTCTPSLEECSTLKSLVATSLKRLDLKQNSILGHSLAKGLLDLEVDIEILRENFEALEDEGLEQTVTRAITWQQQRMDILEQLIEEYEQSSQTQDLIEHAQKQVAARIARGGEKGWCYRYVKRALLKGGYLDEYIWSEHARDAIHDLPPYGFIDITDFGLPMDPWKAPHGSIIVYEGGPYGHIEIVSVTTDAYGRETRRYISDLINNRPVSEINAWRYPTAIFIAVGETNRKQLEFPFAPDS